MAVNQNPSQAQRTAGKPRSGVQTSPGTTRQSLSLPCDPCAASGTALDLQTFAQKPFTKPGDLADPRRVTAAGVLLLVHRYGTRMHVFDAIDTARAWLDDDRLCLDFDNEPQSALLDALSCWPRYWTSISRIELARMQATTLGIQDPNVPDSDVNTRIQPLLTHLLDMVNASCHPDPRRGDPTPGQDARLQSAVEAVRAGFSSLMSTGVLLRTRQAQANLNYAQRTLEMLESHVKVPCGLGPNSGFVGPLTALVGGSLRAEGINLVEELRIADSWNRIFAWLSQAAVPKGSLDPALCEAAAVLRPASAGSHCCTGP